jgi:hypothetical protein
VVDGQAPRKTYHEPPPVFFTVSRNELEVALGATSQVAHFSFKIRNNHQRPPKHITRHNLHNKQHTTIYSSVYIIVGNFEHFNEFMIAAGSYSRAILTC